MYVHGYLDLMHLVYNSQIVITEFDGFQKETCFLKIPYLTVRSNTEKPITTNII